MSTDELLTVHEVAVTIRKGRTTTYDLIRAGHIRSVKIGGSRRVRKSDLDAYVASLEPQPVATRPDRRKQPVVDLFPHDEEVPPGPARPPAHPLVADRARREARQESWIRIMNVSVGVTRAVGEVLDAHPELTHEEILVGLNQVVGRHLQYLMRRAEGSPDV